ncbi:PREDICTED: transcription termination factor 1, mitochondrial [Nanorana parkeri]|uniref:transcription termination factor 1, mitochondrial n=1 Tax=Nanorana parkeri TaxID=125878 RepID=UPI000854CB41|nr:PREDICTED: transcription termination factor 1, mitochondrial [Nanorana parkeri]
MERQKLCRSCIILRERLEKFLLEKGADQLSIENIISRYPKSITLRFKDIAEVWDLWQSVLQTEAAILMIIERSPESFFRSGGVEKLSENLSLLYSLGLTPKILRELVVKSPRTLSYSVELNKNKVAFLRELCVHMGGEDPDDFVRQVITSNIFILTRSTKRLKANIESIQSLMKLENQDLLSWLQGEAAHVLNLCNMYLEENFLHIHQKMQSLGYLEEDVTNYIIKCPSVLLLSPNVFTCKINLLLDCGIETLRILDTHSLLEVSLPTLRNKVKVLEQLGYNFKSNGPGILVLSKSRFVPKLEKLAKLQT